MPNMTDPAECRPHGSFYATAQKNDHGVIDPRGFEMTFANGMSVSVQWGTTNYCENRFKEAVGVSATAEVRIVNAEGRPLRWGNENPGDSEYGLDFRETISGWRQPGEVVRFLAWAEGIDASFAGAISFVPDHIAYGEAVK